LAGGAGQGVQEVLPQLSIEVLITQTPEQTWRVTSHVAATHWSPLAPPQVVVAAGVGQATHAPPQARWPLGQVMPQVVPLQVAVPPVAVGHGVHEVPQVATLVLETQLPEQT
jgi:hypothetical protein